MTDHDPPGGIPGMPNLPDLGGLMDQFQKMQEAQATLFEGQAGGGAVRISATGGLEFRRVSIAPEAVDPDDVDMLQDLVLAALHDLTARIAAAQQEAMGGLAGFGGLPGLGGPAEPGSSPAPDDD
jgi:DNA-binding YbaB/EbfC family protein